MAGKRFNRMRTVAGKRFNRMITRLLTISLLALWITVTGVMPAWAAQEPVFRLDVDKLRLTKGVSSNLILSITNAQGATVTAIEGLEHFDVLSQSTSTAISMSGGNSTYQEDLYYTIMPTATGTFILKATIQYNGGQYETNELSVTVEENPSGGNTSGDPSSGENEAVSDLFVKTVVSQTDAYLGEKVVVTYELYTRYNIENFGFTNYTAIDGVIAKETPSDQLSANYVYLDGIRYAKYEVKQLILDPIQAGTYTLPAFNLQVNVIIDDGFGLGSGGLFGGPGGGLSGFFTQTQTVYLQTEEATLTVTPLPSADKPKNFSGIVGVVQVDSHYSRKELNYGDSLSLLVTASGHCNLDSLKKIFSEALPGFSVYETQKNTTESVLDQAYHVQKEFEVILVPEKSGTLEIEPVSISYFNPATARYESATLSGAVIEVLGGTLSSSGYDENNPAVMAESIGETTGSADGGTTKGTSEDATGSTPRETVRINQVNYGVESDGYITISVHKRLLYGLLIGIGIGIGFVVIIIFFLRQAKRTSYRRKQDKALKSLYKQLKATADIDEIYDLFNAMIKHRYKLSLKATAQSAVQHTLPDPELAARVTDIMADIESHEKKDPVVLQNKIKSVYRMLLSPQH